MSIELAAVIAVVWSIAGLLVALVIGGMFRQMDEGAQSDEALSDAPSSVVTPFRAAKRKVVPRPGVTNAMNRTPDNRAAG